MSRVILYTRAIYKESILNQNSSVDENNISLMDLFNSVCRMNLFDYRTALRDIQIKNFKMIDADNIINNKPIERKSSPSFAFVQKETINKLSKLNDTDVVIPLDDDDWISPSVTNLKFVNGLTAWNGITLNPFAKKFPNKRPLKIEEDPDVSNCTEERRNELLQGFVAGCQGCTANVIKTILHDNESDIHRLLQRHKQTRIVMYPYKKQLNLKEKIYNNEYLHVYVKHAANNSAFKGVKQNIDPEQEMKNRIKRIKNGTKKITNYPKEYEWAISLEKELNELNLSL